MIIGWTYCSTFFQDISNLIIQLTNKVMAKVAKVPKVLKDKEKFPTTTFKTKMVKSTRYMICENSIPGGKNWKGNICEMWERIGESTVSVLCSNCVMLSTPPPVEKVTHVKSDKPKGWRFMKEYVDAEGNVFIKGVEQPTMKGTLNPSVIESKPEKIKISKKDKEDLKNSVGQQISLLKASFFKETKKGKRAELTRELKKLERQLKKLV